MHDAVVIKCPEIHRNVFNLLAVATTDSITGKIIPGKRTLPIDLSVLSLKPPKREIRSWSKLIPRIPVKIIDDRDDKADYREETSTWADRLCIKTKFDEITPVKFNPFNKRLYHIDPILEKIIVFSPIYTIELAAIYDAMELITKELHRVIGDEIWFENVEITHEYGDVIQILGLIVINTTI
jgi:hypothetical protein